MLIDEIKKANIAALKARESNKRGVYAIVLTRCQTLKTSGKITGEVADADVLQIIQKLSKELDEEKAGYLATGRLEQAKAIDEQKEAIQAFLPKQLDEDEIRAIIASLPDKSLPCVMKHFKANYAGQVDMGLVSKIAREG